MMRSPKDVYNGSVEVKQDGRFAYSALSLGEGAFFYQSSSLAKVLSDEIIVISNEATSAVELGEIVNLQGTRHPYQTDGSPIDHSCPSTSINVYPSTLITKALQTFSAEYIQGHLHYCKEMIGD